MTRIGVTVSCAILALLVLLPVGTMVVESFTVGEVRTRSGEVYRGMITGNDADLVRIRPRDTGRTVEIPTDDVVFVGGVFGWDNFDGLLTGRSERNMLLGTLALAGVSTLLALLIGLPLGLLFGAVRFPGRPFFELVLTLPIVLPPILFAIGTYHDLANFEPAFLRAAFVFALTLYPLVSLMVARAVRGIGADALDAARLQTSPFDAVMRTALRPALPGAAAGALLVFVFVIADFAIPDFLGVTTAKNTIVVYANAVFRAWQNDLDAGRATAVGMPVTIMALLGFGGVLWIESKRGAASVGGDFRELRPLRIGRRGTMLAFGFLSIVLLVAVVWPAAGHLETASGAHFGEEVARQGTAPQPIASSDPRAKPASLWDGLQRGVHHERVGESAMTSIGLATGASLLALLVAILATEAGRGRRRLDRVILLVCFLPVAVPPMSLAVGWVSFYGSEFAQLRWSPILLLAARLLPFATFAVRAARSRVDEQMIHAASVAGLPPAARLFRVTLPLIASGAALGLLFAFLFGLREVDALIFTRSGGETMPVQLYNMIHYGFDVQVAGLSLLWTGGVALLLGALALVTGSRFRLLP